MRGLKHNKNSTLRQSNCQTIGKRLGKGHIGGRSEENFSDGLLPSACEIKSFNEGYCFFKTFATLYLLTLALIFPIK